MKKVRFSMRQSLRVILGFTALVMAMLYFLPYAWAQTPSIGAGTLVYITEEGEKIEVATLSATDVVALDNDLLSVTDWLAGALAGKVNSCKGRMMTQWLPVLQKDASLKTLPANPDSLVAFIARYGKYQNRATADSVAKAQQK